VRAPEPLGGLQKASLGCGVASLDGGSEARQFGHGQAPMGPCGRVVDATSISEPGSTGTDWRIHCASNWANRQGDFFPLTDGSGGETWRGFPVARADMLLGDRGYSTPNGVRPGVDAGGELIVRRKGQALPLFTETEKRLDVLKIAQKRKPARNMEWAAWVQRGQATGSREDS
jgi:hypothetical protein